MVLSYIQGLVSRVGLLTSDSKLDVLPLAECSLSYCLTLIERRRILSNKRAEAESRMTKVRWFEKRVCSAEEDSEALCVALGMLTS